MRTLVVPLVGMQFLMTISGSLMLEELGAVFTFERQVFSVAL